MAAGARHEGAAHTVGNGWEGGALPPVRVGLPGRRRTIVSDMPPPALPRRPVRLHGDVRGHKRGPMRGPMRGAGRAGRGARLMDSAILRDPQRATLVFVDVVESVRHIQRAEAQSVARLRALLVRCAERVVSDQGQVIERLGDGLVLRFHSVADAVRCVPALHRLALEEGHSQPEDARFQLRAGVHCAAVWSDADGLYGLGVSLTARVAAMGGPGDTVLTAAARDQLVVGLDADVQDLGACYLKHLDEPVRLFRLRAAQPLSAGLAGAIAARMRTRPTLAVLPFGLGQGSGVVGLVAGPGVGDIVRHQLTGQLGRSPLLHVISALSTAGFGAAGFDRAAAWRLLGADYLVQGEVRGAGGSLADADPIEVRLQLWRAGTGEPVLQQAVAGTARELLSPHSELLARLALAISGGVLTVEQRLARGTAALPNLASHTLYLSAVDLLHRFAVADFERARQMLLALADRAPRHPDPLAWLARWHVFRVVQGWTDDSARDSTEALAYSERALDRDPDSALALTMAGSVYAGVKRDPGRAQDFYRQALAVNPNDSMAWVMSSVAQGFLAAREPALAASETALGLAPLDPLRYYYDSLSATTALMSGETVRALELAERAVSANACHGSAYRVLAAAKVLTGAVDEARQVIDRMLAIEPHFTVQAYRNRVGVDSDRAREVADALRLAGLPER